MTGKAPGSDEYGVASKGEAGRPRVARQPNARGSRDSPPLRGTDRERGDLQIGARFDLDEGDRTAPSTRSAAIICCCMSQNSNSGINNHLNEDIFGEAIKGC